ncbi:DUF221-domain-containing protein [Thozetella sp. PMI_491]|nr:DUF221-domain-containing protein [Thozetella sp. PMI_491]
MIDTQLQFGTVLSAGDAFANADKEPKGSASLAAVLSAFIPTWITGLIFVAAFVLIRSHFPNIYRPRTYMGSIPEKHRTPAGGSGWFDWVRAMRSVPDKFLLYHQSLDTYLYLRFLRTIIFLCAAGVGLTWPTLMPVNAAGGGTSTQLDRLGIGNVKNTSHYYAHAVLAWVYFVFVMFTVARERLWLIGLRQAWTVTKSNASRLSSRTVLFLSAPQEALEEGNMKRIFGDGAIRIWAATKVSEAEALVSERDSFVERLEAAETLLIRRACAKVKREHKSGGDQTSHATNYEGLSPTVKEAIRPTHRAKYSPTSEKRDTIRWLRQSIKEKEAEIDNARQLTDQEDVDAAAAVFVEFKTIADAEQAVQQVPSVQILALNPRYLGVSPKETIWKNLFIAPELRISQQGIATALVATLIVFWSIPSGFLGLVSNISYLAENVEWLAWLNNLPESVLGLLSGLVPPLVTSLLNKYVPNIFRFIFRSFGGATTSVNEMDVQKWFYIFQVTQVFLVTAVFSGAATVFSQLLERAKNPTSVPELLARQLPKSSNYYITYFIIQGITTASDNLLNWTDLVQYLVFGWLFDKTPRQKFKRYTSMKGISWGKVFPKFANFAIIAIAYSCIAPLVLGFAGIGLTLYYFSYRYNLFFVIQPKVETHGRAYTLALQHLLTGLYIAELALIGIFSLKGATGPVIMTAVLFFVTVLYNYQTNKYLSPLEKYLPADLANNQAAGDETTPLLASAEEGRHGEGEQSRIERLGQQAHLSPRIVGPLARFFEPHIFASYQAMSRWLREDEGDFNAFEDDAPTYSEEQIRNAYVNPALTSSTPVVWLPKDEFGTSENEVRETEEAGLKASDELAHLDEKGKVHWDERDWAQIPIWKVGVRY